MRWAVICLLAQSAMPEYRLGLQAYSRDDLAAAEAHLRKARQTDAGLFEARFLLGATLVRLNRREEAIVELEAAHRLGPRHLDALKLLAIQYMDAGRQPDALRLLETAGEAARDEELYLLLIEAHQDAGSPDEGAKLVRQALRRYPESARLNAWMGFEMREAGRFGEAVPYLQKALRLDAKLVAPYFLMGDVLLQQEKYREAEPWLRKTLALEPRDVGAAIALSRALAKSGDVAGAVAELEKESEMVPEDARLALELARLYARQGDREKAAKLAAHAARLRAKDNTVPDSLRH